MDLVPGAEQEAPAPPGDPDLLAEDGGAPRRSGPHVPGLDGIRAVAVIGVLAFHGGVSWAGGGLLGVDIFFVLSGFLITSLLVGEWQSSGRIGFRNFYERRARRLLPALFVTMLVVAAYAQWFALPSTLSTLRGDAFSTLAYVANWRFVLTGQNYFVRFGPPSPLLHTWSLAVEEQFYLVWPAVALFVLRRRARRGLAVVAAFGILASAAVTTLLFHHGVSATRLYYGTDTRVQEVMTGALLALLIPRMNRWFGEVEPGTAEGTGAAGAPEEVGEPSESGAAGEMGPAEATLDPSAGHARGATRGPGWAVTALGSVGAVALLWALHAVSGERGFLYDGGFLLVASATASVILLVVVRPRAGLSRVLSLGALTYIGRISYGLYLYHYPMFLMIDGAHTGLSGAPLLVVRLAATGAAAVVSYHLIEMPIRNRRVLPGWKLVVALVVALAVVVTAVVVTTVPPPAQAVRAAPKKVGVFAVPATLPPGVTPGHPVRILLLGDSLAYTLGGGLGVQAGAWGASLDNQGIVGCDLDPDSIVNIEGSITQAAQGCVGWQKTWQDEIDRLDPDVVAVLLGRWEVSDRIIDGRWTRIGEPAWDDRYAGELGQAIRILSSRGAHVVVFTLPYITQTTEAPDGTPWDINQPVRTDQYNAVVRRTVARYPKVASVIDLNRLLDPKGTYAATVDGVPVRDDDDEHISLYGGMLLRPSILPDLVRLGLPHQRDRATPAPTVATPPGFAPGNSG
jgi:peptidoglycan/LPS O-acetylase OafA/YrhL